MLRAHSAGLDLLVLDAPHLFDRPGNPYTAPDGGDWPDNAFRFGALSLVAARIGARRRRGLRAGRRARPRLAGRPRDGLSRLSGPSGGPATVLTVHNLAYQGQFPADLLDRLRLPPQAFAIDGVESYGMIGFLKAGLQFADRITTVSPTYAQEIQTSANGCGLDGLLRLRSAALSGIRNGIDIDVWNPETDPRIASRFGRSTVARPGAEQGRAAAALRPCAGCRARSCSP